MSRTPVQRPATLETLTYAYAIRVALRRCGIYVKVSESDRGAAIVFPQDANFEAYEVALGQELKKSGLAGQFSIARVVLGKRGETYSAEAALEVSRGGSVIVLVEHGATIPLEILVAVDRVVEVGPIRPRHLISAIKEAWGTIVTPEAACVLCSHPSKLLFAALRRGRSIDVVLRKLSVSEPPAADRWEPRVEDLEGYGQAKTWALDLVQDLGAWREGRLRWRDVDAGLLLSGPPGTGKTLFASAIARSCGATFMPTSSGRWQSKGHLGDMLGAMRKSFRDAAEQAPTILFIDEFDSIGDRRTFRGDNANYSLQVVNALLELLDGSGSREGVVVIAASNYPDNIDPALRRPGRLDRHVAIELPDRAARQQMLGLHLDNAIPQNHLKDIAAATAGYSGAHIEQLARDARRLARRAGREVDTGDLLGLVPPSMPVQGEQLRAACVHEAGHAVVGLELMIGEIVMIVVAREIGHHEGSVGHVQWQRARGGNRSRQSYLNELAMLLAGMAAEQVILGEVFDGSGGVPGSDLQRAVDIGTLMLANLGLGSLQFFDVSTSEELDELRRSDPTLRRRVERLLKGQLARAVEIIRSRRADTEALIAILSEREVMSGHDVARLLGRAPR
ncbi:AAA family ATPase [Rhizobium sp. CG5]|uniref:AAA family ATPase n=1 Tax=Rhizobium sp. CG5 TaxID=2726076 RepID=UPI00203472D3|nr:AAA family ATPase [Rhizobium sp. CG5]MCM2475667.1 AAA family ATPase [Rhizobium sp. CG5]